MEPIRWLETLQLTDTDVAGGKGANLGDLVAGDFERARATFAPVATRQRA